MSHELPKMDIDGEMLRQEIEKAGYSLSMLAKTIGYSDRQIRYYLAISKMPEEMYQMIRTVIPPAISKMVRYGSLYKRLKTGIAVANNTDSDFVYIRISDAKQILKLIDASEGAYYK